MIPKTPPAVRFLALLVLLLPLLAACGGAPASSGSAAVPMAAPAERPAAPGPAIAPAAPAATTAPAATAAPVMAAAMEPAVDALDSVDTGAPRPAVPAQQLPAMRAGEVDDNADFADYLAYLGYPPPGVATVDVSERYLLTVVNDAQQPVLDARVRVFDGQALVFEGRTYAGGRTILFPRALGISENSAELRVTVEKGNSAAEATLRRGQDGEQTIVLDGATALPQQPRLDVLFLLDATGSMGDEIGRIQDTIAEIAARIDRIEPRPLVRFALVSYRDRGDEYVARTDAPFTADVAGFRDALLRVRADGGGDTPEDLNEGLRVALQELSWSDEAVRLTFLVADAAPHMDYGQQFVYTNAAREAVARGVKIYPIAASNTDPVAEYVFRQLAQQTLARFIFLTYQGGENGGAPGDTTQMQVDPAEFTVERLDDLVVRVVEREMAEAAGAR
jgi:hypothetical protein